MLGPLFRERVEAMNKICPPDLSFDAAYRICKAIKRDDMKTAERILRDELAKLHKSADTNAQ